jgi:hypothetical protein
MGKGYDYGEKVQPTIFHGPPSIIISMRMKGHPRFPWDPPYFNFFKEEKLVDPCSRYPLIPKTSFNKAPKIPLQYCSQL